MRHQINYSKLCTIVVRIFFLLLLFTQTSCKKYLDKKSAQNLAVPETLDDLQAILDNQRVNFGSPAYLEVVADNYYVTTATWLGADLNERLSYVWDKNAQVNRYIWLAPYEAIYDFNLVLDFLPSITFSPFDQNYFNSVKGTALFYRSFMFHQLAQLFCKPYSATAGSDLGIVLRLKADVEAKAIRATVDETYAQIINDLKNAVDLLPETTQFSSRPNKAAAYGLLARVYLSMKGYTNAYFYANASLLLYNRLLDYNTLSSFTLPLFMDNPEILFWSQQNYAPSQFFNPTNLKIDSTLYQSYHLNDLRRSAFFGSSGTTFYWKGSYSPNFGSHIPFDGIATDEIYFIRAESRVRNGDLAGINDLNTVLVKRWKSSTFTPYNPVSTAEALNIILTERRKELLFRGLRWSDLRRYNLEGSNISLTRIVNGVTYTLPPNDPRWVLLIPDEEISRSNIPQNPR